MAAAIRAPVHVSRRLRSKTTACATRAWRQQTDDKLHSWLAHENDEFTDGDTDSDDDYWDSTDDDSDEEDDYDEPKHDEGVPNITTVDAVRYLHVARACSQQLPCANTAATFSAACIQPARSHPLHGCVCPACGQRNKNLFTAGIPVAGLLAQQLWAGLQDSARAAAAEPGSCWLPNPTHPTFRRWMGDLDEEWWEIFIRPCWPALWAQMQMAAASQPGVPQRLALAAGAGAPAGAP